MKNGGCGFKAETVAELYNQLQQLPAAGVSPGARIILGVGKSLGVGEIGVRRAVSDWERFGWWNGGLAGWFLPTAPREITVDRKRNRHTNTTYLKAVVDTAEAQA